MMVPFFFNSLFFELGEGFFSLIRFFFVLFVWIAVLVDRCKWIVVST